VVLYSNRPRDAGYRLGYVGKWHASYLRTPLDFGFHEVADLQGCDPRLIQPLDTNPDGVERPRGQRLRPVRPVTAPAGAGRRQ
jgi:arylsulfatase A-like enzyme